MRVYKIRTFGITRFSRYFVEPTKNRKKRRVSTQCRRRYINKNGPEKLCYIVGGGVKESVYFRPEKLKRVSKYIPNQIYSVSSISLVVTLTHCNYIGVYNK